jgi:erythromycin esterase-like protein
LSALDAWLDHAAIEVSALNPDDADLVVLGELNHFVHEKSDFRIALANPLVAQGFGVFAEEIGWSDGARIDAYLRSRDEAILSRISLFGWRGDDRADRDDRLKGVFQRSLEAYPAALMQAEQTRFYRSIAPRAFFGFDVAAGHAGGYADLEALVARSGHHAWARTVARTPGETIAQELGRLRAARASAPRDVPHAVLAGLEALVDGLSYLRLVQHAPTYEATRPAMAFREEAMKRRITDIRRLAPGRMVLMGHALHLAKHDGVMNSMGGIGPGGDRTSSLGRHIAHELGLKSFVVWMIYGGGSDSQPLTDLARTANFTSDTLNARLAARFDRPTLLLTRDAPMEPMTIGHMYNATFRTVLPNQADALYFVPKVTPMRL